MIGKRTSLWLILLCSACAPSREQSQSLSPEAPTADQTVRIRAYLKDMEPGGYQALLTLDQGSKSSDPEIRRKNELERTAFLTRAARRMEHAEKARADRPEEYRRLIRHRDLDRLALEISEKIRTSSDEKVKTELKARLKNTLYSLFDVLEESRAAEADSLERQARELRSVIEKRKTNRDRIVESRLQNLIGEPSEDLEWAR